MKTKEYYCLGKREAQWLLDLALEGAQSQRGSWMRGNERLAESLKIEAELDENVEIVKKLRKNVDRILIL